MKSYNLQDAIFGTKYISYARHRMRYFLLVSFFSLGINIIEIDLMHSHFSGTLILPVVMLRLIVTISSLGWWGILEIMREQIRGRYHFSDKNEISSIVGKWTNLSYVYILFAAILPVFFILKKSHFFSDSEKSIYVFYTAAFVIESILNILNNTYRSGVFAIKRIYRPLGWVIIPGFLGFIMMFLLWKFIGLIGIPIALIFTEFLDFYARTHFVKKTYKQLRIRPQFRLNIESMKNFLKDFQYIEALKCFTAGIFTNQINLLLILAIIYVQERPMYLIYLFFIRQIYHAFAHWGQMFYYDFKKLISHCYATFYRIFLKKIFPISFFIALIFTYVLFRMEMHFDVPSIITRTSIMFILFVLCAIYSVTIMHAFSLSRFIDITLSGIIGLEIMYLVISIGESYGEIFSSTVIVSVSYGAILSISFTLLFLMRKRFNPDHAIETVRRQSIYNLALRLENSKRDYQLIKIKTNSKLGQPVLNKFLDDIARAMKSDSWLCPLKSNEYLLCEIRPKLSHSLLNQLNKQMVLSCTTVISRDRQSSLDYVLKILSDEIENNLFYQRYHERKSYSESLTIEEMFKESFPEGFITNLKKSDVLYSHPDKSLLYKAIEDFYMAPLSVVRKNKYSVSIHYEDIPKLFVVSNTPENFKPILAWNVFLHYLNFSRFSADKFGEKTYIL